MFLGQARSSTGWLTVNPGFKALSEACMVLNWFDDPELAMKKILLIGDKKKFSRFWS